MYVCVCVFVCVCENLQLEPDMSFIRFSSFLPSPTDLAVCQGRCLPPLRVAPHALPRLGQHRQTLANVLCQWLNNPQKIYQHANAMLSLTRVLETASKITNVLFQRISFLFSQRPRHLLWTRLQYIYIYIYIYIYMFGRAQFMFEMIFS